MKIEKPKNNNYNRGGTAMDRINERRNNEKTKEAASAGMITIPVFWRKAGQYNILETTHFGFACSVIADGVDVKNKTITYDPKKANMVVNKNGYMTLVIKA